MSGRDKPGGPLRFTASDRELREPFHHQPIGQAPATSGEWPRADRGRGVLAAKNHIRPDSTTVIHQGVCQTIGVRKECCLRGVQSRYVRRREDTRDDKRPTAGSAEQGLLAVDTEVLVDLLGVRVRIMDYRNRVSEDRIAVESSHGSCSFVRV
jgi:hypothetical protein